MFNYFRTLLIISICGAGPMVNEAFAATITQHFYQSDVQIYGRGPSADYEIIDANISTFDSRLGELTSATLTFGYSFTGRLESNHARLIFSAGLVPEGSFVVPQDGPSAAVVTPTGDSLSGWYDDQSLLLGNLDLERQNYSDEAPNYSDGSPIEFFSDVSVRTVDSVNALAFLTGDAPTSLDVAIWSGEYPKFERLSPIAMFGEVAYDYTPVVVPLPASGLLLFGILALCGIAMRGRRDRRDRRDIGS